MSFIWPALLATVLLVPLAVLGYIAGQRRRNIRVNALASSGLVTIGSPTALGRRRHVPFLIFMFGFILLAVSVARPQVALAVPQLTGTVVLAVDVSNSMAADDIKPSRLAAAQAAAKEFVQKQPSGVEIGLVALGSGAQVVAEPTDNRQELLAAIDRLSSGGSTQIGTGLLAALNTILDQPVALTPEQLEGDLTGLDIGYHPSAAIVLASDGEATGGPDPDLVADIAAAAGVKITTVGIGSADGAVIEVDGYQVATSLDAEFLGNIAELTGGKYYQAQDANALLQVYDGLDMQWEVKAEEVEVTALFSLAAVMVFFIAAILSMRWLGRVV
ncbi:MAG: VWA domain-containing protein [Actinomycetota bacterium]|nr:VWA domain-containing protein [Actinomycetota bacterium]MDP2288864.1 VWA domain-containing protein [Actinomycetota bacterium]